MILISFLFFIPQYSLSVWRTNLPVCFMCCKPLRPGFATRGLCYWLTGYIIVHQCAATNLPIKNKSHYFFLLRYTFLLALLGILTVLSAFNVVSSREAAKHPSSVEPPSHIPAKAAMLLWKQHKHTPRYTNLSQNSHIQCPYGSFVKIMSLT